MKKFITIIAGVVLAASLTTVAAAQAAGPTGGSLQGAGQKTDAQPGKKARMGLMKMIRELDLTKVQQKEIKELAIKMQINAKNKKGQTDQKDQKTADKTTKVDRQKMQERRKEFMAELEKILTPEQNAKLKKMIEDAKKNGANRATDRKKKKDGGGI